MSDAPGRYGIMPSYVENLLAAMAWGVWRQACPHIDAAWSDHTDQGCTCTRKSLAAYVGYAHPSGASKAIDVACRFGWCVPTGGRHNSMQLTATGWRCIGRIPIGNGSSPGMPWIRIQDRAGIVRLGSIWRSSQATTIRSRGGKVTCRDRDAYMAGLPVDVIDTCQSWVHPDLVWRPRACAITTERDASPVSQPAQHPLTWVIRVVQPDAPVPGVPLATADTWMTIGADGHIRVGPIHDGDTILGCVLARMF